MPQSSLTRFGSEVTDIAQHKDRYVSLFSYFFLLAFSLVPLAQIADTSTREVVTSNSSPVAIDSGFVGKQVNYSVKLK